MATLGEQAAELLDKGMPSVLAALRAYGVSINTHEVACV